MAITITVLERAFDEGRGLARDMRVRWALEEVGQPYEVRLVPWEKFKDEAHLQRNPFGQIPTYEEGDLTLFESGAIVLHIAERFPGLLPLDADARSRAIMRMFAALGTVEPPIVDRGRLDQLTARMGDSDWLDGAFSAADIIMVHVLRRLEGSGILKDYPTLVAYIARAEARPAYKRAFAAQLAVWEANK